MTAGERAIDPALVLDSGTVQTLHARLAPRASVVAGNLWGSSQALVLAALVGERAGPFLVVCSTDTEAEAFADDLAALGLES